MRTVARRPDPRGRSTRGRPARPERGGELIYILFNKPDGVLTQFRPVAGKETLADYGPFPKDVHPVGRLDEESEGLLLLTNDGALHHRLIEPKFAHPRTYLVQVERVPDAAAISRLRSGVALGGSGLEGRPGARAERTRPAEARLLLSEPGIWAKRTPIRFRKTVPTAWLEITLTEGKNRQVRRMTAAVGHPALRVVRTGIGPLLLAELGPGESRRLTAAEVKELRGVRDRIP